MRNTHRRIKRSLRGVQTPAPREKQGEHEALTPVSTTTSEYHTHTHQVDKESIRKQKHAQLIKTVRRTMTLRKAKTKIQIKNKAATTIPTKHIQCKRIWSTRKNACHALHIAEINIRGVNAPAKRLILELFGNNHKLDIICLAETKHPHTSQEGDNVQTIGDEDVKGNYTYYFSTSVYPKHIDQSNKYKKKGGKAHPIGSAQRLHRAHRCGTDESMHK